MSKLTAQLIFLKKKKKKDTTVFTASSLNIKAQNMSFLPLVVFQ